MGGGSGAAATSPSAGSSANNARAAAWAAGGRRRLPRRGGGWAGAPQVEPPAALAPPAAWQALHPGPSAPIGPSSMQRSEEGAVIAHYISRSLADLLQKVARGALGVGGGQGRGGGAPCSWCHVATSVWGLARPLQQQPPPTARLLTPRLPPPCSLAPLLSRATYPPTHPPPQATATAGGARWNGFSTLPSKAPTRVRRA